MKVVLNIEPDLYRQIEEAAQGQQASPDSLVTAAIRQYLWELDRHKIAEESSAYRRQHAELKQKYAGRYIAMRNGHVVDHDEDFTELRQRINERFAGRPIYDYPG